MAKEYILQEAHLVWEEVKNYFKNHQNTPYLITDKNKNDKVFFKVFEENEDNQENYSIFDEEKIVIYPTCFQKLYFRNRNLEENKIIEIIQKEMLLKTF